MGETEKTKQELKEILINVAQLLHIDNYDTLIDITPSKTEGFLSEIYTGEIKNNNNNGEITAVAVKKAPKQAGIFDDFVNLYRNEDNFYSKIFPDLFQFQQQKHVPEIFEQIPKYFFGNLEPEREHIVMENVIIKGYKLSEKSSFFNNEYLDLLFKVFGKFHALSFAFKHQNSNRYNELLKHFTDIFKNKDENDIVYESIATNVLAGLKAFDPVQDRSVCKKLRKIENVTKVLTDVNNYTGHYRCIIHGDCWSNNLLFKIGESGQLEDVKLVDFQMIRESTPVHDLSFLFYSGASEPELGNLDTYLEIYYQSFSSFAKCLGSDPNELYPFEVLKQEWQRYGLLGVFLGFDLLVLKFLKPEKALEMRNMEEVNKEEGLKMWDEEMTRIRKTQEFTSRSRALILSAIQHGLL